MSNIILDLYIHELTASEFKVYLRLFRLSHGFHTDTCTVSLRTMANTCKLTQVTLLKAIRGLLRKSMLEIVDRGSRTRSAKYRVLRPYLQARRATIQLNGPNPGAIENEAIKNSSLNTNINSEFDLSPLSGIDFGYQHLARIQSFGKLSNEEIQNSIDAFAHDLKFNHKLKFIKGAPAAYLVGILKRGPYLPAHNFISRTQKRDLEQKRLRLDEIKNEQRRKNESLEKRRNLIRQVVDKEYEKWLRKLSEKSRREILPDIIKNSVGLHSTYLRSYFEKEVLQLSIDAMSEGELQNLFSDIGQIIKARMTW